MNKKIPLSSSNIEVKGRETRKLRIDYIEQSIEITKNIKIIKTENDKNIMKFRVNYVT